MTFGIGIQRLREARLAGLHELASQARIPCSTLSLIESDLHFPRLSELERLLAALNVRFHDVYLASCENSNSPNSRTARTARS